LEEELAKLPEKTRQHLYEHKALGKTAEEVAASYGVRKSTVTESARRGLASLRPALTTSVTARPSRSWFVRSSTG